MQKGHSVLAATATVVLVISFNECEQQKQTPATANADNGYTFERGFSFGRHRAKSPRRCRPEPCGRSLPLLLSHRLRPHHLQGRREDRRRPNKVFWHARHQAEARRLIFLPPGYKDKPQTLADLALLILPL
jgi:hypothetical protein